MASAAASRHMETVRELSKPGQALAVGAATASINNPAWWIDGETTRTRDVLHARLIDRVRAAVPDAEQNRQAIVLAGPPGAGKSTVLDDVLGEDRGKYLVIDADEFKRSLLREALEDGSYDQWLVPDAVREREAQGEKFYPLELASLVHEESSYLAKEFRADAIDEGYNIVIDTVLSNETDARALGQRLTDAGYDVRVIDVEVPYEVSEERIRNRWEHAYTTALDGGDSLGGRWVPSEYARDVFNGPGGTSNRKPPHAPSPNSALQSDATVCSARQQTKPEQPTPRTVSHRPRSRSTSPAAHTTQRSSTRPSRAPSTARPWPDPRRPSGAPSNTWPWHDPQPQPQPCQRTVQSAPNRSSPFSS